MLTILEWTATLITVGGAVATALAIDPLNIVLFNIGSILWTLWGWKTGRMSIVTVNTGLIAVYVYGLLARI
jgi:hypothetical protein